jgi:hypothetical protein
MKKLACILLIFIFVTVGIISCDTVDSNTPSDQITSIRTDSTRYFANLQSVVPVITIQNNTDKPIFFPTSAGFNSNPFEVEKRVDGEWTFAYTPFLQLTSSPPLVIEPDSVLIRDFPIFLPSLLREGRISEINGSYRLKLGLYESVNVQRLSGELLPRNERISNTFEIVE